MKPIITSLLDTDLYKFTMWQAMLHRHPQTEAEYEFVCRTPTAFPLAELLPEVERELDALCSLRFDKDDVKFLVKFPAELIGKEPEGMPKQGFYNGGERMNILLQALLWLGFVVSGLTLWLGAGHISPTIRTWMIPLHSLCAGLGFAAAIGHIYLAIGVNPDSFQGMRDGTVKESYAKHHHAKWVDSLEKEGKLETVERIVK